jgi:WD40 repeat protein
MRPYVLVLTAAVLVAPRLAAQERLTLRERSAGNVVGLRYSPDGSRVAVAFSREQSVRVYPSGGGPALTIARGHDGVSVLEDASLPCFTPDGRGLVCRTTDHAVKVYDAATGAERQALTGPGLDAVAAVSPDRRSLAVGAADGGLRLLDLATLGERHVLQRGSPPAVNLALSPDGRTLAAFHPPAAVRVWRDGKEWDRFEVSQGTFAGLSFSPDGAVLAAGLESTVLRDVAGRKTLAEFAGRLAGFAPGAGAVITVEKGRARFLDLAGQELLAAPLDDTKGPVRVLPVAGGRSFLARSDRDGGLTLYEASGDPARPYKRSVALGEPSPLTRLAVTPDGRTALLAGADRRLRFIDTDPSSDTFGNELAADGGKAFASPVVSLIVSPDNRRAAAILGSGVARLWDVPARREVTGDLALDPTASIFQFNADASLFTAVGLTGAQRWEVATGKALPRAVLPTWPVVASSLLAAPAAPLPTPGDALAGLAATAAVGEALGRREAEAESRFRVEGAVAAGGGRFAKVDRAGRLWLIDLATEKETVLHEGSAGVLALAFSADGRLLASCHSDGRLRTWDPSTGRPAGEPIAGPVDFGAEGVVVSPGGKRVLTRGFGRAGVWDLAARKLVTLEVTRPGSYPMWFAAGGAVVRADEYGTGRSWDAATGRPLPAPEGAALAARGGLVSVSPDGKHVAAALADGAVLAWAADGTGPERALAGGSPGGVKDLRFSPDGRVLAAGGMDGNVRLWDPATGKLLKELRKHTQRIAQVVFSPDGKVLMVEAGDGSGSLWEADPSAAAFGKLQAAVPDLHAILERGLRVWSPDGKLLAVLANDRVPRVIDPATGNDRSTLPAHVTNIVQMVFAADSRTVVTRTTDGQLQAWDGTSGQAVKLPDGFPATAPTLIASADGWLAAARDDRVALWRGPGGKLVELDAAGKPLALAFSPNGKALAAAGASARLWRRTGEGWEQSATLADGGPWSAVEVSDGGVLLLKSAVGELVCWDTAADRKAVALPTGSPEAYAVLVPDRSPRVLMRSPAGAFLLGNPFDREMKGLVAPPTWELVAVTSADGRTTVTGSSDGAVRWYSLADVARPARVLYAHAGQVKLLALSPDGGRLLTASTDGQVKLWDMSAGPRLLRTELVANVLAAGWAPDGKTVAYGTQGGNVTALNVAGARPLTLQPGIVPVRALFLSRDGRTLAEVSQSAVRVYDTQNGAVLARVSPVTGAALSPDGQWLATTDNQWEVHLHEARTGKDRGKLAGLTLGAVQGLVFSPDSRTLSASCRDGFVRTWNLATNEPGEAKVRAGGATTFSGDGRLQVGYSGEMLTAWEAATGKEVASWRAPSPGHLLSASADGKLVLNSGYYGPARLYEAGRPEPTTLFGEVATTNKALLTPDGKTAVGHLIGQLVFWDVARGTRRSVVANVTRDDLVPAMSDDGRWLAVALRRGGFKVFDVATGRERAALLSSPEDGDVTQFVFSGDGSTLVATAGTGSLRVFDVKAAAERGALAGHTGPVTALAQSAGGLLAAAGEDRTVRLFDPAAPARPPAVLRGSAAAVLGVAISPDGRAVAGTSADGTVRLWPGEVHAELLTLSGHTGWANRVHYLVGGKRALSTGNDGLRLWDLEKGTLVREFAKGLSNGQLGVSADGKHCLTPDGQNVVREFDLETGREVRQFKGYPGYVWAALYLPGGKEVLTAGQGADIHVWDRETGMKTRQFESTGELSRYAALSPDGKRLATGDFGSNPARGTVRVWDLASGKPLRRFGEFAAEVSSVAWSPDGKRLVTTSFDRTARVWDAETGKELLRITQPTWVDCAAWLPDGKRVLTTANVGDNRAHLWDAETGKELRTFTGHTAPPITVDVAPDGHTALTTGKDGTVRQWNLRSTAPVLLRGHEGEAWAAAFSPDGKLLATAGADRKVRLWDVSGDRERPGYGRPVRALEAPAGAGFLAVAFAPDGTRLAAGEGDLFAPQAGAVRLWDVASGELLATMQGHAGAVRAVAFSPDGKLLASGGLDRTIRLWGAADGKPQGVWKGHATAVLGLAFGRDGGLLASAGGDPAAPGQGGEVLLWDVASGRQRGPLVGHRTGLTGVAVSPDGTSLYAAGYDETVRVWALPPQPSR